MTLIVAGIENNTIWMLGDSLLSGGNMRVRDREYAIKIERGGNCVVGFSGDAHLGQAAIRQAADLNDFRGSVDRLTTLSKNGGVDFAFGWHDGASRLVRIVGGIATEVTTLHLGSEGAFAKFQEIRNTYVATPAPNAHKALICGSDVGVPQVVVTAITSLFDLFAERQERDVGGWVLGYLLDEAGPHLCAYAYAVSDPVMDQLHVGDSIPHGTAARGGLSLSVTGLAGERALAVYWLQRAGGHVFLPSSAGYEAHAFHGSPADFKSQAKRDLGIEISLWMN